MALAGLLAACGSNAEDQGKTYILNDSRLSDAITLWGQTLAVSGRHANMPSGLDLAAASPVCLGGDTEGTVSVFITGCQNSADAISCQLPETYDCNYAQGSLNGTITSSDTALTVALASTNYTEGNVDLLGIELLYEGQITITSTADSSRVNQAIKVTVSDSIGATVYDNSANWDVERTEDQALFSGRFTLPTELGDLTVESTRVAFQPGTQCAGPVKGQFDLRFGSSEHARIVVQDCGSAKLLYVNTNDDAIIEEEIDLTPDLLRGAFAQSAADIGKFVSAASNLSQHATLYDSASVSPLIWCRLFESATDIPLFAQYVSGARANPVAGSPVAECLLTMPGAKFMAGLVAFTRGLGSDPTAMKVLSAASGSITLAADGISAELVFEKYVDATYVGDLDHLTAAGMWAATGVCLDSVAGCEHITTNPWTSYGSAITVDVTYELNHFGAWMTVTDTSANYFAVTLPD